MQQFAALLVLFLFRGGESCETHILAIHVHCQNIAGAIFDIYGTPSLIFAGCWLNAISKTARCAISQRVLNFVLFASHLARKNPYGDSCLSNTDTTNLRISDCKTTNMYFYYC